jgi:16S rRNA (guanine527-N7)-methyltransferase
VTSKEFSQRVTRRARRAHLVLPAELVANLWTFFELLFRWNAKINLTSLSLEAPDEAIDRLLIEPILAAKLLSGPQRALIDIGSGGGSPAIPMALAAQGVRLVMVESKARKSAFLREALRQLSLDGKVETTRFEELLSRPEFHEAFDFLTIRAVRTEPRTLVSLQAFVRPGGRLLLFRSNNTGVSLGAAIPPLRALPPVPLLTGTEIAVLEKLRIP